MGLCFCKFSFRNCNSRCILSLLLCKRTLRGKILNCGSFFSGFLYFSLKLSKSFITFCNGSFFFRDCYSFAQMDLIRATLVLIRVLRTLINSIAKNLHKLQICLSFYSFYKKLNIQAHNKKLRKYYNTYF